MEKYFITIESTATEVYRLSAHLARYTASGWMSSLEDNYGRIGDDGVIYETFNYYWRTKSN